MAQPVIEETLKTLESEVGELFYAMNGLESTLEPVLGPCPPTDGCPELTGPAESPVTTRLRAVIEDVRARLAQIQTLRGRVEVDGSDSVPEKASPA